jgi:thiol-disulfide isomerase/thioredoxin
VVSIGLLPTEDCDKPIRVLAETIKPISFHVGGDSDAVGEQTFRKMVRLIIRDAYRRNPQPLPVLAFLDGDVEMSPATDPKHARALRYISQPELARARMTPALSVTTMDVKQVSMDNLQGKVVLLDFWATWCQPCREGMPHIRKVGKKFEGQLVILRVSLDNDEQKWKEFVGKNEMTWMQYRDGGFTGPVATMFGVKSIPHTYTIDADGVLQQEHIGDSAVEGKLKRLLE